MPPFTSGELAHATNWVALAQGNPACARDLFYNNLSLTRVRERSDVLPRLPKGNGRWTQWRNSAAWIVWGNKYLLFAAADCLKSEQSQLKSLTLLTPEANVMSAWRNLLYIDLFFLRFLRFTHFVRFGRNDNCYSYNFYKKFIGFVLMLVKCAALR